MPYFHWHGIDDTGNLCDGYTFALTKQELLVVIQAEQIQILRCFPERFLFSMRRISLAQQIYLFKQLAILIESGVLLPDAFLLVIKQLPQRSVYTSTILFTILANIQVGNSCAQSFGIYQNIFGKLTIALIQVAEETGQLPTVLNLIGLYWEQNIQLRRKIRAALMVPSITIICFCVLLFLLMYWVIPMFETILQSSGKTLPIATAFLLHMSAYVCSVHPVHIAVTFVGAISVYLIVIYNSGVQYQWHRLILCIPLIGTIKRLTTAIGIAQSLSILINGGVPLVSSLYLAREVIHNHVIAYAWDSIIRAVENGMPLSKAIRNYGSTYFMDDFITLVAIGEESERLDVLLLRIVSVLKEQLDALTHSITQLIQPICMVVLGGLIGLVIIAIYGPLFDISNIVTTW